MDALQYVESQYNLYVADCNKAAIAPLSIDEWVQTKNKLQIHKTTQPTQHLFDPVNHPKHYNSHPSGIECIEVTRHFNFNVGNAIKYLWRAGQKGNPIEDLEKAIWYIRDEISRIKEGPAKAADM